MNNHNRPHRRRPPPPSVSAALSEESPDPFAYRPAATSNQRQMILRNNRAQEGQPRVPRRRHNARNPARNPRLQPSERVEYINVNPPAGRNPNNFLDNQTIRLCMIAAIILILLAILIMFIIITALVAFIAYRMPQPETWPAYLVRLCVQNLPAVLNVGSWVQSASAAATSVTYYTSATYSIINSWRFDKVL